MNCGYAEDVEGDFAFEKPTFYEHYEAGIRLRTGRNELIGRAIEVSEVFHPARPGAQFQGDGTNGRIIGPAAGHASYGSALFVGQDFGGNEQTLALLALGGNAGLEDGGAGDGSEVTDSAASPQVPSLFRFG